jgi:hypothetical protein
MMTTTAETLKFLIPTGGWVVIGDDYEGIQFLECEPITKKQFTDGVAKYNAWKTEQDNKKTQARSALLERLGITADEAKLLLG